MMTDFPDEAEEAVILAFHEFDGFKVGTNLRPIARAALTAAYPQLLAEIERLNELLTYSYMRVKLEESEAENARLRARLEPLRAEWRALYRLVDGCSLPMEMQPWRQRLLRAIAALSNAERSEASVDEGKPDE